MEEFIIIMKLNFPLYINLKFEIIIFLYMIYNNNIPKKFKYI